ncbi:site-specific integrase [Aurantimonas sp. E1-2-R+4]|uniref:site-specific integrase n=1 Tax=Aurantimonas sp. E1-2-R+4 TaxID=3113714 RepID=UPI002F93654D
MATRITKRSVDEIQPAGKDRFLWDSELTGFGLKVTPAGRRVYLCQFRLEGGRRGRLRRYTIGTHGAPWTPEQARSEAKRILGLAANGHDPANEKQQERKAPTVAELCDQYLLHGCATKKASTLATDRGRIERHIKPLLGRLKVKDVTKADVRRFLQDVADGKTAVDVKTGARGRAIVKGGKGTASRTVGLLGGIFSFAVDQDYVASNVIRGIRRFPDKRGDRFLSAAELARLGDALRSMEQTGSNALGLAIIKLLIFTGARKGEIEGLQWNEVDFERGLLRLRDSKTGQKAIILNPPALEVLVGMNRLEDSPYVFPASRSDGHYEGTPKLWQALRRKAVLNDVRLHDLRHSFASVAVAGGASLPIIGALLGHGNASTTQRYAHLSDDPLSEASARTSASIRDMMGESTRRIGDQGESSGDASVFKFTR